MSLPLSLDDATAMSAETVDFICVRMLTLESPFEIAKDRREYFRSMLTGLLVTFVILAIVILYLYLIGVVCAFSRLAAWLLCLVPIVAVLVALWRVANGRNFMDFPSNLRFDHSGLTLLWLDRKRQSHLIPWAAIKKVSVAENYIHFVVNTNYCDASWLDILTETSGMWSKPLPIGAIDGRINLAYIKLSFPLSSLTLDSDASKLMALLASKVDEKAVDPSLIAGPDSSSTPSYTRLWLDDLHTTNRVSIGDLKAGTDLQNGLYEVHEVIGSGGQAKIYRAIDRRTQAFVVLKETVLPMYGGLESRERAFDSVKKEAVLLRRLDHCGIVKLIDNFVEDHRAYLVMENLEGQTLRQMVQRDGPLPVPRVREIASEVIEILNYLHQASPPILHRDLSPDNLMMLPSARVCLIDFSVAQDATVKSTRTVVGKSNYVAPEQFKGNPTTQSDLYSFGATLFYLLTGHDPVAISTSLPSARLGHPCELDGLVSKLTKLDPADRFMSAADILRIF